MGFVSTIPTKPPTMQRGSGYPDAHLLTAEPRSHLPGVTLQTQELHTSHLTPRGQAHFLSSRGREYPSRQHPSGEYPSGSLGERAGEMSDREVWQEWELRQNLAEVA